MEEEGADAWGIFLLSLAMLIGCFIAGSVPLSISLSESKTRFLAVLGAGLLVGTSLAVIIPEGIHSMYANKGHQPCEDKANGAIGPENNPGDGDIKQADAEEHVHTHAHGGVEDQHYLIGVALVIGFVFMLCVDQIGGGGHSHSVGPLPSDQEVSSRASQKSITATLGLVVHAAADGVAMGAAATASGADIQMIVFIAIMLHKAPAAFGLVTFLMHENYERNRIRKHLLIFSLAAPVVAMLSYFSLSHASKEALVSVNATGLSMLFSAGTFLYVATVHVLPEIVAMKHHQTLPTDQGTVTEVKQGLSCSELTALVCSCMAPLLLAMGHHH